MKRSLISRRQHEQELAAQRRRHEAELAALKAGLRADIERLRAERTQFAKDRDTQRDAAKAARAQIAKYENGLTTTVPAHDPAADRKAVEAWEQQAKAHNAFTPGSDDERLFEGGHPRPTHPALILQRALDRCRALEARLTTAEGRRTGAAL